MDRIDSTALAAANRLAQRAFHTMLVANCHGDPEDPRTRAYTAAERLVDELMADAQGRKAQAELDVLIEADRDDMLTSEDAEDLSLGDHYLFPEGVIESEPAFNGSFR
jgi:hypothetical protein